MACRRRIAHGEVLPILRCATPYFGKRPCAVAAATAASRVETESLERTEETWWSTVFADRYRRAAISALVSPCASKAMTSSSREVRWNAFVRVLDSGASG